MEEGGEKLRVFGREVFSVDEYLKNIRGDIVLTLDADNMMMRPDELNMLTKAKSELDSNLIDNQQYQNALATVNNKKIGTRMKELKEYLDDIRFDDLESGVGTYIILKQGETILEQESYLGNTCLIPLVKITSKVWMELFQ